MVDDDDRSSNLYATVFAWGLAAYVIGYWSALCNLDRLGADPAFAGVRTFLGANLARAVLLISITTIVSALLGLLGAFFGFLTVQMAAATSRFGPPPFAIGVLFMLSGFACAFSFVSLFTFLYLAHHFGLSEVSQLTTRGIRRLFIIPTACGLGLAIIITQFGLALSKIRDRQNANWEALHSAVDKGNYKTVEELLNLGVSPNAKSPYKQTALLGAVIRVRSDIVELLLSKGANINDADIHGITPLGMAARKGSRNLIEFLISKGANVDGRDGLFGGPLIIAVEEQFSEIIELLLLKKANVNACPEQDGRTALHVAAYKGYKDIVGLLLRYEADVQAVDKYGKTPADYASQRAHSEILKMLKDKEVC